MALHAVGFTLPLLSPAKRCALNTPFHPYLYYHVRSASKDITHNQTIGGIFSVALALTLDRRKNTTLLLCAGRWALPTTVSCRARTFLHYTHTHLTNQVRTHATAIAATATQPYHRAIDRLCVYHATDDLSQTNLTSQMQRLLMAVSHAKEQQLMAKRAKKSPQKPKKDQSSLFEEPPKDAPSVQEPQEDTNAAAPDVSAARVLAWLQPNQTTLVSNIAADLGINIVAAGGPGSGGAATVSNALGVERSADFRHEMHNASPDLIWLLTLDGLGQDELFAAQDLATPTLIHEPIPDSITDCPARNKAQNVRLIPLMRNTQPMRTFAEIQESFGPIRSLGITMRSRAVHGSLYAKLTDAMDMIIRLCGLPELVDAAISGPFPVVSDNLRSLQGHLTANARFADNCCACIHVSNHGGSWFRGITMLGDAGCIRMTDQMFEWRDPDAAIVDAGNQIQANALKAKSGNSSTLTLPESLIADQLRVTLDPHRPTPPPRDISRTVAACEAVRLSLRTGQGETPRKLLELITG